MISKVTLSRGAQTGLRSQCRVVSNQRRGLAAAASGSFSYETGDAAGVKYASRDIPGATTTLAVVARAGTRFQPLPGFSEGLGKYAFKSTTRRSALRINREAELLGGQLFSYHTRENLVVGAKFLREDLPYFTELLAEVVSQTKYNRHELDEEIVPSVQLERKALLKDTQALAINSAHAVAFHRGLGEPLHPTSSVPVNKYYNNDWLHDWASAAYKKSNYALVANGAESSEFAKWAKEFFSEAEIEARQGTPTIESIQTKYHGGEERIAHDGGNAMVLAFPGSSSFTGGFWKPEIAVLAALLGGETSVKWAPGFSLLSKATEAFPGAHVSTQSATYSDAGLLYVTLSGKASQIKSASAEAVKAIKAVADGQIGQEEFKKAVATAKFRALETGQSTQAGILQTGAGLVHGGKAHQIDELGTSIGKVTESQLKSIAKTLLEGKATVSTVGDLHLLPYAEEIGLKV